MDVDPVRLLLRLAIDWKSIGRIYSGCTAHVLGTVPLVRETMPLLLAQPAAGLLALLDLFQYEIGARMHAVRLRRFPAFSYASIRNCARRGARRFKFDLSAI